MIIKYQSWLQNYNELNTEEGTQTRLDVSNKTRYRDKVEKGILTAKQVAEMNHNAKLHYEFCAFEQQDDVTPLCYVTVVPCNEYIGVNFIDGAGRNYLSYQFHEMDSNRRLFMGEAWYLHFTSETHDKEDYRLHFVFDEEGNIAIRQYDEIARKTRDFESNRRFDIKGLYEDYPAFDAYDSLIRLERDLPIPILPTDRDDPWTPPL